MADVGKLKKRKKKRQPKPEAAAAASAEPTTTTTPAAPDAEKATFADLGLEEALVDACAAMKFKHPTPIQREAIPHALTGRDVIGLAETGSGKTAAFALPVLQALLTAEGNKGNFCLVMAPTRELAFQIKDTFNALGASVGLKTTVIVGGIDMMQQAVALAKRPHVIIATPGRIVDHLQNTKGFHLRNLKFLIMDEADRILNMDFEKEVDILLKAIPRERTTFLFSATMTSKVAKLQRASLSNPIKVEVSSKYATVKTLQQRYIFIPQKYKDCYLVHFMNEVHGNSVMIFCSTCANTQRVTILLRSLGFKAICLHGQMTQPKRLGALGKFSSNKTGILVATDVASRGLDIPHVDIVVNFDIPMHSKDYIHRVGRTARAGRAGKSLTFVTQYDVELFQRIEHLLGEKMDSQPCEEAEVLQLLERVTEAQRTAAMEMKAIQTAKDDRKRQASDHGLKRGGKKRSKRG